MSYVTTMDSLQTTDEELLYSFNSRHTQYVEIMEKARHEDKLRYLQGCVGLYMLKSPEEKVEFIAGLHTLARKPGTKIGDYYTDLIHHIKTFESAETPDPEPPKRKRGRPRKNQG